MSSDGLAGEGVAGETGAPGAGAAGGGTVVPGGKVGGGTALPGGGATGAKSEGGNSGGGCSQDGSSGLDALGPPNDFEVPMGLSRESLDRFLKLFVALCAPRLLQRDSIRLQRRIVG